MEWIALFLASIFETLWASSLKFLSISKIKKSISNHGLFSRKSALTILPLMTYVIFGILNIACFSYSCKILPLTICFAIWMGLALCIQTLIDVFLFKEKFNLKQILFMSILMVGIIGLKFTFKVEP